MKTLKTLKSLIIAISIAALIVAVSIPVLSVSALSVSVLFAVVALIASEKKEEKINLLYV